MRQARSGSLCQMLLRLTLVLSLVGLLLPGALNGPALAQDPAPVEATAEPADGPTEMPAEPEPPADTVAPTPEPTEPPATDTPTPEPTPTDTPTTDTPTPEPTATDTPTPLPTDTATPEATATETPAPAPTATETATVTPESTSTLAPTDTPEPCPTLVIDAVWALPDADTSRPGTQVMWVVGDQDQTEVTVWLVARAAPETTALLQLVDPTGGITDLALTPLTPELEPAFALARETGLAAGSITAEQDQAISATLSGGSGAVFLTTHVLTEALPQGDYLLRAAIAGREGCDGAALDQAFGFELLQPTPTPTDTPSPTPADTSTPVPTATDTAMPAVTETPHPMTTAGAASDTPEPTPEPTATATPEPTATETVTSEPTAEPTPTEVASPTPTPTNTATSTSTPSPTDTATLEPTVTPTFTEEPTLMAEPSPPLEPGACPVLTIDALWALPDTDDTRTGTQLTWVAGDRRQMEMTVWLVSRSGPSSNVPGERILSARMVNPAGAVTDLAIEPHASGDGQTPAELDPAFVQAREEALAAGAISPEQDAAIGAALADGAAVFIASQSISEASPQGSYTLEASAVGHAQCRTAALANAFSFELIPPTATPTSTDAPTSTLTVTPESTHTATLTAEPEPTSSPTITPEPTETSTTTPEPVDSPTSTPQPTDTDTPDAPTATPETTDTGTPASAPEVTATPSQTPTETSVPTVAPAETPTATDTATDAPIITPTPTPSTEPTPTETPTEVLATATLSPTSTQPSGPLPNLRAVSVFVEPVRATLDGWALELSLEIANNSEVTAEDFLVAVYFDLAEAPSTADAPAAVWEVHRLAAGARTVLRRAYSEEPPVLLMPGQHTAWVWANAGVGEREPLPETDLEDSVLGPLGFRLNAHPDLPVPTATEAVTDTPEPTPTETPTATPTPSVTPTEVEEPTPTIEPSATPEPTSTPEATPTEVPEPTESPTPTVEATATETPTSIPEPTGVIFDSPLPTPTEAVTETPEPLESSTVEPTEEATPTLTPTADACAIRSVRGFWVLPDENGDETRAQVTPLLGENREVQAWLLIEGAAEAAAHGFISGPDGSPLADLDYAPVLEAKDVTSAIEAAYLSGAIDSDSRAAIEEAVTLEFLLALRNTFYLSPQSAPGEYRLSALVQTGPECADLAAATSFQYEPLLAYEVDFDDLAFGQLTAGGVSLITGDKQFQSGDGRPTIRNVGNVPLLVSLTFTPMLNQDGTAEAGTFRAAFLDEETDLAAGETYVFSNALPVSEVAGISVWLQTPLDVPAGTYSGSVDIAVHQP